jgi:hypothetical protein
MWQNVELYLVDTEFSFKTTASSIIERNLIYILCKSNFVAVQSIILFIIKIKWIHRTYRPNSSWMSKPMNSHCIWSRLTFSRTNSLSSGCAWSTNISFFVSVAMKDDSSTSSRNAMKEQLPIEMIAPMKVGCVRSLGIFLYMSNLLTSKPMTTIPGTQYFLS